MKGSAVAECGARRGILNRGDLEEKHIPDARCLHVLVGGRAPRSHLGCRERLSQSRRQHPGPRANFKRRHFTRFGN
jgi:hypothetical protein